MFTSTPGKGFLTRGSSPPCAFPSFDYRSRQWHDAERLPTHSGGTVLDSHQLPFYTRASWFIVRSSWFRVTSLRRAQLRAGQDADHARLRIRADPDGTAVGALENLRAHHLLRAASGQDRSALQQQESVRTSGR